MAQVLERWEVQPHGALEEVADGVLTVTGEIVMPLGSFPRRMTVVRLSGNRTAIWSAIALDEPQMDRIEALGLPTFLIVPSDGHRMDAKIWKRRYFNAMVVTPRGAEAKVGEIVPVEQTGDVLGDPDVHFVTVPGTGGHESALIVRRGAETTLIVNDVIAHVAHPHGLGAHIMARLFGFGVTQPAVPRLMQHMVITDKAALAAQFRAWADLPGLKRIIPSHGEIIDEHPSAVLCELAAHLC